MRLRDVVPCIAISCLLSITACSWMPFGRQETNNRKLKFKDTSVEAPYSFPTNLKADQGVTARNKVALAEQRVTTGQYQEAESNAQAALELDPKLPGAYTVLALVATRRNHNDQAGEYYAKAAALAPLTGSVLNNYGAWLCSNNKVEESLPWFERALSDRAYQGPATALANAGACAFKIGRTEYAERALRSALQADPKNAIALAAMAELQYEKGNYLEARAFSERRIVAAPVTSAVLQLAAQIENKLGDAAAAARYTQRVRSEFPTAVNQTKANE